MAFFKRKEKGILDLTEKYKRDQERAAEIKEDLENSKTDNSSAFGFLGKIANASNPNSSTYVSSEIEERKRELSKKLLQLTEKIEDLSNQIYHLQQRIEVLERKAGVGGY